MEDMDFEDTRTKYSSLSLEERIADLEKEKEAEIAKTEPQDNWWWAVSIGIHACSRNAGQ